MIHFIAARRFNMASTLKDSPVGSEERSKAFRALVALVRNVKETFRGKVLGSKPTLSISRFGKGPRQASNRPMGTAGVWAVDFSVPELRPS